MGQVKILHLIGKSSFGGASYIILPLAALAARQGWEVEILATDPSFQRAIREAGIRVVDLDIAHREIRPFRDMSDILTLARFLRAGRYTIVQTHTSKGGFLGRAAAKLAGVPVIIHTAHGFAFHEGSPPTARLLYTSLERLAARWCDRIVCVSEFHRDLAIQLGIGDAASTIAIPNGISAERLAPTLDRAAVRREWGVGDDVLAILAVGRIAPQKGLEYLVRAAVILKTRARRPFRIILAGEGPLRHPLEELARRLGAGDCVTFLGFRRDVGNLLGACDIVVLPSLWEGLSIALLEAMAAGKPIVTTRIASNLEVAGRSEIALFAPPADEAALAEGILRCIEDPAGTEQRVRRGQDVLAARYTEDRMLRSYERLYLELLETKCGRNAAVRTAIAG